MAQEMIREYRMPAKDMYHDIVKEALINDGWEVTDDPLWLGLKGSDINLYIDLAAEKLITANRDNEKIAVEIKSFTSASLLSEFHAALGQFLNYRVALESQKIKRELYLAIPYDIFDTFFSKDFIKATCKTYNINLIVFNLETKRIVQWKK